ncbi:hypothetical protein [Nocardia vermiculata]|uniref:Major capsid protein n=1 Tax=Nocardia vermiculata TaxID=257274 RepID=A0A846XW17_9NOCA|nr:hypothetical protein [Nocardia vermiculata]NKY50182.1 hypothetical protein [Nocardia vermiculata]
MTNPLPPVVFEAPPVTPAGYGLLAAATVTEMSGPARQLGGVEVYPYNCDDGYGTYSTELCDDDPAVKAAGERGAPLTFDPVVVYAASECRTDQTEAEVLARAAHTRSLHEPLLVESAFAARLLADAGTPTTVPDLASAIGTLEEFLGEQGYNGYIHAARRWAARAADLKATNGTGAVPRTNIGNGWVFGGGYASALGNTLVATGPLFVWRYPAFEQVVTTGSHPQAALNNTVYGLSERIVTVAYECDLMAVTIDATP